MSVDGAPRASEQQPSEQEVLNQAATEREALSLDLLSQYPAITARVTELATRFPDFNPDLNNQAVWKQAASILLKVQEESRFFQPEYHITSEPDDFLLDQIRINLADQAEKTEEIEKFDDTQTFLILREQLKAKHGGVNQAYLEAFKALLNDPEILATKFQLIADSRDDIEFDGTFSSMLADRIKLVNDNIAALQAMAGASPEYATQVEQAGVDVTDREAVQAFVVNSGFMEDATISEATKTEVAQRLDIIRTATSMLSTLENIRSNSGQFVNTDGQTVTFDANNGVPVGRYTVYPDPTDHTEYVATTMVGGRALRVPFSPTDSPAHLGRVMKAAMVTQVLANRDFQGVSRYILGGDGLAAQGMAEINLDGEQVARAERLYGAFMGFGTVVSPEFPNESELKSFEWRLQATHIDGDAKTNDNTDRGDLSWRRLGLLDESGQVNLDQVEAIGAYMNSHSTSLPTFDEMESTFGQKETPSF